MQMRFPQDEDGNYDPSNGTYLEEKTLLIVKCQKEMRTVFGVAIKLDERGLSDGAGDVNDGVNDDTQQTQSQFFAAQTLHTKYLADVHQLPPLSLPSLRDSLLSHFARQANRDTRARAEN